MSVETVIKIAAKLYEARETLIHLHGRDQYLADIVDVKALVNNYAKAHKLETLPAVLKMAQTTNHTGGRLWLFAAGVEIVEPLEVSP